MALPLEIRNSLLFASFKRNLKTHLATQPHSNYLCLRFGPLADHVHIINVYIVLYCKGKPHLMLDVTPVPVSHIIIHQSAQLHLSLTLFNNVVAKCYRFM